jgi:hypothetical protein
MTPAAFIALPGFFRIEKGSAPIRGTLGNEWVDHWMAGATPIANGRSAHIVIWGEGMTAQEAIDSWEHRAGEHLRPASGPERMRKAWGRRA